MRLLAEVQNKLLKSKHKNISPHLFHFLANIETNTDATTCLRTQA